MHFGLETGFRLLDFSETVIGWLQRHGPAIVGTLIGAFFLRHFGSIVISRAIKHTVRHTRHNDMSASDVSKRQTTLISLTDVIWKWFVLVVAGMILFKAFFPQVNLTPLFASAGIIGVALGFGAQSLIKDFLTGLFIITENQYRVGDVVDLEGAAGTVEKVGIRSTVLRDIEGNVHYMPNGNIMHVINKTMGFSKVNLVLAVDPDTNVDKLAKVINETGAKLAAEEKWKDLIIEPPSFLNIGTFSDIGMEVTIVGKTQPSEQWSVGGETRRRLLQEFKKHKIELARSPTSGWPVATKK